MEVKPGYKQSEAGVIPEDWQLRPLLSAVRVASGQVDPKVEPFRSMTLVAPDHIESGSGRLLQKQTAADQRAISGKYMFAAGDIVYSKIRPYLRKAILAHFEGLCSADMYPLRPSPDVSAGFIFAAILGHHFSKYAESVSVRSGMPKINRAELAEYTLALPPTKREQEAIAEALSDADVLIESLEQLIAKKHRLKQGTMQELLTGKRRLPEFEVNSGYKQTEVGVIPEEWGCQRIGGFIDLLTGFPFPSNGYSNSGVRLLRGSNVKRGCTDWSDDLTAYWPDAKGDIRRYALRLGDIVVAMDGSLVGRSFAALGERDVPSLLLQRVARIRSGTVSQTYLSAWICSQRFTDHCDAVKTTTAIPHISPADIRTFEIALPPTKAEQEAIAAILSNMGGEIDALQAKLAKARSVKQGMMQQLLTGKVRLV
jgi:type I restriction enzyme S subunit